MAEQLEKEGVGRYAQYAELPAVRVAGKLQIRLCAASKIVRHRVMRQKHARTGLAPGEDGFRAGMTVPALVYAAQTQALYQYAFVHQQPHMPAHQLRKAGDFAVVVAHAGVYAQPGAQQGQGARQPLEAFRVLGEIAADTDYIRPQRVHAGEKRLQRRVGKARGGVYIAEKSQFQAVKRRAGHSVTHDFQPLAAGAGNKPARRREEFAHYFTSSAAPIMPALSPSSAGKNCAG